MNTDNSILTRVISDGDELENARVFIGDQPVPWLHEIRYTNDMRRRRVGFMHVDYRGWHAFLRRENRGTHQPIVFAIHTPCASVTMLQVWAKNLPPTGRFPTESLVLAPLPGSTN